MASRHSQTYNWMFTTAFVVALLIAPAAYAQKKQSKIGGTPPRGVLSADDLEKYLDPVELSAQQIARRALPAVPLLICDDGKNISQGSGFFVRPGVLLTNYHVIKGMARGFARIAVGSNKEKRDFRIVRILGIDEEADLALLSIPEAEEAGLPVLPLVADPNKIEVGETIYALGNPKGLAGTISPGIVSAGLRSSKKNALLQITAPISHGSSGGPVVNSRGEVIGVAVGSLSEGQNLNFAVPVQLIAPLISRTKIPNQRDKELDEFTEVDGGIKGAWFWPQLTPTITSTSKASAAPPVSIIGPLRQGESSERASLRKLAGVYLAIEDLNADAQRILSQQQIRTEVELRLRRNRVRLLTKDEWLETSGYPNLYLNLNVIQSGTTGEYSYSYMLSLRQYVSLERDPLFQIAASTWWQGSLGYAGSSVAASAIREAIGEAVDEFCNEYLAANASSSARDLTPPPPPSKTNQDSTPNFVATYVGGNRPPQIEVKNTADRTMNLNFGGSKLVIPSGKSETISTTDGGMFSFEATAPGIIPLKGERMFERGHVYTWTFFIRTK